MKRSNRFLSFLAALLLVAGATLIWYSIDIQNKEVTKDADVYEALAGMVNMQETVAPTETDLEPNITSLPAFEEASTVTPLVTNAPTKFTALPANTPCVPVHDLSALQSRNKDFIAWLNIPGTVIDYPVVLSNDSEYYLHHLFTGEESKLGCLFSLTTSDYQTPSQNIAIYGHHLSNSDAMFSSLISYKDADYCQEHSLIQVDSLYGIFQYRIFAVLNQKVTDWDASTASFTSDTAFLQFVQRAQSRSLYETNMEVMPNDHILTLITCDRSYGGLRGRLVIMAKEETE